MAVGYSLIYSLLRFTNFAHAIAVTIGAYVSFFLFTVMSPNLIAAFFISIALYESSLLAGRAGTRNTAPADNTGEVVIGKENAWMVDAFTHTVDELPEGFIPFEPFFEKYSRYVHWIHFHADILIRDSDSITLYAARQSDAEYLLEYGDQWYINESIAKAALTQAKLNFIERRR